jgi:hypothetical protein
MIAPERSDGKSCLRGESALSLLRHFEHRRITPSLSES